jgi:hypothetical protein
MCHQKPGILTRPVDPGEITQRMKASLEEERAPLMTHYRHYRYAFPDRASAVIDNAAELESKLLTALLDGRPSAKVLHPHPCDLQLLGRGVLDAAEAACEEAAAARSLHEHPQSS